MNILEILFLVSITFSMIKADEENICLTSTCSSLFITFPFKLHNSQTQDNCSYIDLKCNYMNETATINLQNAGDYYVRTIDYEYPYIQLYDTPDCAMMRRFMSNNFSLSPSPFKSILDFFNYTFYSCPPSYPKTDELIPIDCLSTPTNVTVAAYSPAENVTDVCHEIGSRLLPIMLGGDYHDLYLTWDPTTLTSCPACQNTFHDPPYTDRDNSPEAPKKQDNTPDYSPYIVAASLLTAAVIVLCLTFVTRMMVKKNEAGGLQLSAIATAEEAAATPPGVVEESRISSYTELLVLSESIIISYGSDSRTCPICLESFEPRDLSRSVAKCGHCFHDECVLPWLIQTGTCPVCRINISDP